jgi:hypothetical protein
MLTGLDFLPPEYQGGYATVGANSFPPPFVSFVVGTLRPSRLLALRVTARFGS